MKLVIDIKLDNSKLDAYGQAQEVERLLKDCCSKFRHIVFSDIATLHDSKGNVVGSMLYIK